MSSQTMKTVLEELLMKNQDNSTKDKFYKYFSSLNYESNKDLVEDILPKIHKLFKKNVLSKNILYLSLLLNDNRPILDACFEWEKVNFNLDDCFKDPNKWFDYTIYTKKHWFYHLISNYWETTNETLANIQDKLLYLQLVTITNEPDSPKFSKLGDITKKCLQVPSSGIDPFWIFYVKEVNLILKILEICHSKDNFNIHPREFIDYSTKHSILSVCSEYSNLTKTYKEVENLLTELNQSTPPHNENLSHQIQTLSSFGVLANLLKLILPSLRDNQPYSSVNEEIKHIQSQFLQLKDHKLQIELLQLIFTITFLQFEHVKWTESTFNIAQSYNFICNEKEVRLILFILKSLIENIEFNKIFENDPHCTEKLNRLHGLVIDATRRLDIVLNTVSLQKYEGKFLYYMLATPEGLLNLCLKKDDFEKAYQVLKVSTFYAR